jgi:phosphoserine phosphatase RsbU/P
MTASFHSEAELDEVRQAQHRFLGVAVKDMAGLDYDGLCKPAAEVGGDFFDFLPARDGSLLLSIGDVTGKGVPAALIMAGLQASVRTLARSRDLTLSGVIYELNRMLWGMSPANIFATMFYARIDNSLGKITYVNAGHEPALLVRPSSGRVWRLTSTGTVLGLSLLCSYKESSIECRLGDILVAFTDGISDASDQKEQPFSEAGVLSVVEQHSQVMSSGLVDIIMRRVESYSAASAWIDDRTVSIVKFVELSSETRNRLSKGPGYIA